MAALCAPQRTNYFTVFWVQEGSGTFCAESGQYPFSADSLLFPAPGGELVPAYQAWHEANNTYGFAYGLGAVIVIYGLLLCLHPWRPQFATVGSLLVFVMSFVTLSFLITTPETWVPAIGGPNHGFPYLSGAGRLVVKDAIMMGAALVTMADSARAYLCKRHESMFHSVVGSEARVVA